jgi:hypothetical protein
MLRKSETALRKSAGFQLLHYITGITTKRYNLSVPNVIFSNLRLPTVPQNQ